MMKDLPFILSMGPQRAGTSWLDRYLRSRGDICLPDGVKETFFFDRYYDKGRTFYEKHFKVDPQRHVLAMEFSTTAFDHPKAPERALEFFGSQLKMLCPLRDPVDRSRSLYWHYKRYGIVSGTLQEACKEHPQILTSSHYAEHLAKWLDIFPARNIGMIYQETLDSAPEDYVKQVCMFLNIPYIPVPPNLQGKYNATTKPPSEALASYAQNIADGLRERGLYAPVNLAKKIGLKNAIFGKDGKEQSDTTLNVSDQTFLEEQLTPERDKLAELLDRHYGNGQGFFPILRPQFFKPLKP